MTGAQFREAIKGKVKMVDAEEEVENSDGETETKRVKKVVCEIGRMDVFRKIEK